MKTIVSMSRNRRWTTVLVGLSLFCLFVINACGPTPTSAPTATPILPTEVPITVAPIAEDIATDVGQVMTSVEGNPDRVIIVFEETHDSPAGQIEIAIMLNRLYEGYDLRHMGLEGAIAADGVLDATWFHYPSPLRTGDLIQAREDVAVQMLEDGDINSMEMMALVYDDAEVVGIEKKEEYDTELPEGAGAATTIYLYKIAVPGLTQSEISQANDLMSQDKILEAVEFIISTDEYTEEMYARLSDPSVILSCEKLVELVDEIEAKAADVAADITSEDKANLKALRTFYQTCVDRSKTMVDDILSLLEQFPGAPLAMTIGAAHTEGMSDLFTDAGVSFAVIRPNSLAENREEGDLSFEAYDRKLLQLSVDPPGSLGALLDGRRKPPPAVGELWAQSKAEVYLLTTFIARAAAQGQPPPFDEALEDILPKLKNVTLMPDTIQVIENDVVFSVQALNNNSQPVQIWVRTRADKALAEKTLEERLFEALSNVHDKEPPAEEPEPTESEPTLIRVSSDTIAKFSTDQAAIVNTTLGG
jgi:hypothetical protein